jgi:hypothetical protein
MNPSTWAAVIATMVTCTAMAEVQVVAPQSDAQNYKGDDVSFKADLTVKVVKLGSSEQPTSGCVAAGSQLRGLGTVAMAVNEGKDAEQRPLFQVVKVGVLDGGGDCQPLQAGQLVALPANVLSLMHRRAGWSFGTLAVPYKYQLRGDRSLSGGATLGGYVGRRFMATGLSNQLIVFAGLTKVDIPKVKDDEATTEQVAGLSYGVGMLSSIKDSFQLGLVVGADRVSKSAGYVNNGKPWVSLSLGFDFFN